MKNKSLFILVAVCIAAASFCSAQKKEAREKAEYVPVKSWQEVVETRGKVPDAIKHPPFYDNLPKSYLAWAWNLVSGKKSDLENEHKKCMENQLALLQAAKDNNIKAVVPVDTIKDSDATTSRGAFVISKALKSPLTHAAPECNYAFYGSIKSIFYMMPYCKYHGAVDCSEKSTMLAETKTVIDPMPKPSVGVWDLLVGIGVLSFVVKILLGSSEA